MNNNFEDGVYAMTAQMKLDVLHQTDDKKVAEKQIETIDECAMKVIERVSRMEEGSPC